MNFEDFSYAYDQDERPRPPVFPPQFWGPPTPSQETSSQRTVLPYHGVSPDHFYQDTPPPQPLRQNPPPQTPSPQPTVIPWAPSPPENSPPTLYATDRLFHDFDFGPPLVPEPPPTYNAPRRNTRKPASQAVRFDEAQLRMDSEENAARARDFREELALSQGQVTPGVDETPFIQYALDAITRDDGANFSQSLPSGASEFEAPDATVAHQADLGYDVAAPPTVHPNPRGSVRRDGGQQPYNPLNLAAFNENTPSLSSSSSGEPTLMKVRPNLWSAAKRLAVPDWMVRESKRHGRKCPRQDHKPWILQLPSFIILMTLCCLMIAALVFSAIYSKQHREGFMNYAGTINHGQFFLFRLLPQILAAVIFLYAQAMIVTTFRILPFTLMAQEEPGTRYGAIFQSLYPKSFLWPHMVGPKPIKLVIFMVWLMNFTIPLHSTLFTVIPIDDDTWAWATVQGSAYALIALYIIFLAAMIILAGFWSGRITGMLWDVRSIADMVPMLHHSNVTHSYKGTQTLHNRKQLRSKLRERMNDRIGFWRFEGPDAAPRDAHFGHTWWGMGTPGEKEGMEAHNLAQEAKKKAKMVDSINTSAMTIPAEASHVRHRYLPWCMRDTQILYFVVAGFVTLIALFVVSFNPKTRLSKGFKPELDARPDDNAFSPANFLYSFIPSLLGQIIFCLFQALVLSYRQLAPWAEMSKPEGGLAEKTILVDYAACLPFEATFKAARNRHYRVAFIDLLSTVLIFIPILAGGLFMALTVHGTTDVRMFPSTPVFGVLLMLLCLFVCGLVVMIPNRDQYRLPHAVTCLAEIISFVSNDDILQDPAFRFPRDRMDLLARLGLGRHVSEQTRWSFGVAPGRDETLGVRRVRRFTEKTALRWGTGTGAGAGSGSQGGSRKRVAMQPQQAPIV